MTKKTTTPKAPKKATSKPKNLRQPAAAKGGDKLAPPIGKAEKAMSGLDAAAKVLADAKEPMNATAMVETMLAKGMWKTNGRTPQATIYAAVIREIAAKGAKARFKKIDRGMFTTNA